MDEILREGVERGRQVAKIKPPIGNDSAQPVYEKAGFRFSDENHCPELTPPDAPAFARFLRQLQL
ncbi:MAG: hypothetical protein WBD87_15215 [Candidatus Acidiferrales bacterium]